MSDLVTGEAVVLGLPTAKLPSRALARVLDLVVQLVGLLIAVLALGAALPDADPAATTAIGLSVSVFFLVLLPIVIEVLSRGRSLGKLVFGLRVVRSDGGPVRFRHALVRGLVGGILEFYPLVGAPAVICSLIDEKGRRLGDIFCGAMVIRERLPAAARTMGTLPPVPPQLLHALGGELVALDFSAVPEGLWLAIRQFLSRYGQLDPAVASGMAERLVGDLVAQTGHPAPPGVVPAAYLGAVLTERQRRDWARANASAGPAPRPYLTEHQPSVPQSVQDADGGGFVPPA